MKKPDFFQRTVTLNTSSFRKRMISAFLIFIILIAGAVFAWQWLNHQPKQQGALQPLRKTLETNEKIFSSIFSNKKESKTYTKAQAVKKPRVNGNLGLRDTVDVNTWRLQVIRATGDTLKLTLDEIKQLPKKDVVFDFKCIEGWDEVTHWAGVPLEDFLKHYHLQAQSKMHYIGLATPDKKYYVGIDMKSALHPQTILCYEVNDHPLPLNQGFPLRLIIPVKYGIKHLKRIGTMYFSNQKPADYWAERGYDYYGGL
jgi:DMSO/TMAO reductase YedYZ molybdopterin-dependent catalytic subunit